MNPGGAPKLPGVGSTREAPWRRGRCADLWRMTRSWPGVTDDRWGGTWRRKVESAAQLLEGLSHALLYALG